MNFTNSQAKLLNWFQKIGLVIDESQSEFIGQNYFCVFKFPEGSFLHTGGYANIGPRGGIRGKLFRKYSSDPDEINGHKDFCSRLKLATDSY